MPHLSHFRTNYTSRHYNHLLNFCSSLPELTHIHALILKSGCHHNLQLTTRLVSLACRLAPNMEYARQLFDVMPHRDIFLWNNLIRGYAVMGPCQEGIVMYRDMHGTGELPDDYTFSFVLRCCGVVSAFREGREVHCNVIKNGLVLDYFLQNSLVTMYAQCGDILCSEKIFEEMTVRDVVGWTAIISGYVQNGFFEKGLRSFWKMVGFGTQPNEITLVSILPACAGLEYLNLGKSIHGFSIKLGMDSGVSLVNTLIALYGKCRNVDAARSLFDQMPVRSLVSWNAMIAAYEQNNASEDAIKHFRRMQREKIKFSYITMVSVISACSSLGDLTIGRWIHQLVRSAGFETNVSVTNALIDMYAKCGNIDLAIDVFNRLPHRSVVSWTSILGACAAHGNEEHALELFSNMMEEGTKPNSLSFTAVLTACRHSGLIEEGRKYFKSMVKDYSIAPGVEHCTCMVDLLGRGGQLVEAYEFVKTMPVQPDIGVWGALLSACRLHGNLELAERVADQLHGLGPQTASLYVHMINIYAEAGRWEDVSRLRNLMKERELIKTPGQSLVEVNRRFFTFFAGSKSQSSGESRVTA